MRYAYFNPEGRVDTAHNDDTLKVVPEGAVELTQAQFEDRFNLMYRDGNLSKVPFITPKSLDQVVSELTNAVQKRLDDFARTRNYDGIISACTYATSAVAKFKAEGQACVNLRDATWSAAYNILSKVQDGTRPMPASIADIEADLPALVWPS